jgi:catechol 2,3-dioxygenase-like lactoylglutathione lyase family enzyme
MAGVAMIQHVALDVDDLGRAMWFYCEVLGMHPIDRPASLGDNGVWLSLASGAQLHLVQSDTFEAPRTGQHVAFQVDDIDGVIEQFRKAGAEPTDAFDVGAGRQSFLRDPAGNLVELNQPT